MICERSLTTDSKKDTTKTAKTIIDPEQFLHEQLAQASPDLMRELLWTRWVAADQSMAGVAVETLRRWARSGA